MEETKVHKRNKGKNVSRPQPQQPSETEILRQELLRLQFENAQLTHFQQQYYYTQTYGNPATPSSSVTIIQSPSRVSNVNPHIKNIYLGGYIGNDDWQKILIDKLKAQAEKDPQSIVIFNPRRPDWKISTDTRLVSKDAETMEKNNQQLSWELDHLESCNCAIFYFAWDQNVNNVGSLLQLGRISSSGKIVFVCIHSRNKDKKTIYEFIKTRISNAYITSNMEKLCNSVSSWILTGRLPDSSSQGSLSDDAASVHSNIR